MKLDQLDLEIAIEAQKYVEQGYCGQDAYDMAVADLDELEGLRQELEQVTYRKKILEYGDDMLYTNVNGNLEEFRELTQRAFEIQKEIEELQNGSHR